MPEYRVTWEIDLKADSPEDAAREALEIQRDQDSTATVFDVFELDTGSCEPVRIDLTDLDEDYEDFGPLPDARNFRNFYLCPGCGHEWEDVWTAQCDDDCPACGTRHISPYKSEDVL